MLSERAVAHLYAHGHKLSPWSADALERWLTKRGAPLFEAHMLWESTLDALTADMPVAPSRAADAPLAEGFFLLGGIHFGAVGLASPFPEWTMVRRDGETYVLVAMAPTGPSRRFYMSRSGKLFLSQGRLWLPIADNPYVTLERMAARASLAGAPCTLTIGARAGAALAAELHLPAYPPVSDSLQRGWLDERLCIFEGAWERPTGEVMTVWFDALSAAREVIVAVQKLGLSLRLEPLITPVVTAAPSVRLSLLAPETPQACYAAPSDCCQGVVAYTDAIEGARLVQIVRDAPGGEAVEIATFSAHDIKVERAMAASHALEGTLSPRALSFLDKGAFLRDPRRTCSAHALVELLSRSGLPWTPPAAAFETTFGGVLQDPRVGGFRFGTFDMLAIQRSTGQYGGRYETEHAPVLLGGDHFPRVRWEANALIPVGDMVSTHLYMAADGMLYEHAWEVDELYPCAERGVVLFERLAAEADQRRIMRYKATIAADVGIALAEALGLAWLPEASCRVATLWEGEGVSLRADHGLYPGVARSTIAAVEEAQWVAMARLAVALAPSAELQAEGRSGVALRKVGLRG
jgi:hypothetical protein